MKIETDPIIVTKDKLLKKKENAELGIELFEKEIAEIEAISQDDINEAERIEKLLLTLKKSRKLESKKNALVKQKSRLKELNKAIKSMSDKGLDQLEI